MDEMKEHRVATNGVELCVFERPGEGPTALMAHATGFHSRCWDQVTANLPGWRVLAVDTRGHGRSSKPPPPYRWASFVTDMVGVIDHFSIEGAIGVGHSKGGTVITMAAVERPKAFRSLLLVDPAISARAPGGERTKAPRGDDEPHFVAMRRNRFATVEAMIDRMRGRGPYEGWDEQVLDDYCRWGLLPVDGEFELACPPAVEAAVYAGASELDPFPAVEAVEVPVRVLRARDPDPNGPPTDMTNSPTAPDLASRLKRGEDVHLPQFSHFIPMQDPALVARHIIETWALGEGG